MNTQEMIKRYRIALKLDEHGQPNGNLVVYRADKAALAAIKAAKPEIVATLLAQRDAGLRAEQERQSKIDAIPGLREIKAARTDFVKPKYDMDALHAKYPRAKAYLDAEDFAASDNDAKTAAGRKALEAIINGENYEQAIHTMNSEWSAYCEKHIWD